MIGIVVVSHSPRLAEAAVELALEMVHGEKPSIAIAAGTGDGAMGTDAVRVAQSIAEVSSPDGVLVFTDLGSAVLSAELALELIEGSQAEVRICAAPFVEGLLAGIVRASAGASLDEVEREALGALASKQGQLAERSQPTATAQTGRSATVVNRDGMHIRPASVIVAALAQFDASVWISNDRTAGDPVRANSPTGLLTLAARRGDTVTVTASGAQADEAVDAVVALVESGFGELDDGEGTPPGTGPIGVSPGRAAGRVVRMPEPLSEPPAAERLPQRDRAAASSRIADAAVSVQHALEARAQTVMGEAREILEATAVFAADAVVLQRAQALVVSEGETPERAVWQAIGAVADTLRDQGPRAAERVADLHDVRNRIVAILLGRAAPGIPEQSEPFVLVASDLAPADAAMLGDSGCVALITVQGGPTSHTTILVRSLGIPAAVVATAMDIPEGSMVLVDGTTGAIAIDPSEEQLEEAALGSLVPSFDGAGHTADGHRVQLLANVGSPESVGEAVAANAEGIGLFRTEFSFMGRPEAPSVEEQVTAYRAVFAAFGGRKVIVRTLDAGADKPLGFVTHAHSDNPALGIRGYRTSWHHPQLLDDQLAAIALAAKAENAVVGVMAPMIATVEESEEFARSCRTHGLPLSGAMIETPAAALSTAQILQHVDFVSLGTNDLAQYTMAADRLVGDLAALNDPWQPAVLRMIATSCEGAGKSGKPIGVCGEAAADPLLAAVLVGLGVTSLSMSPRSLAPVAALLARVTLAQCTAAAELAVAASSAAVARAAVTELLHSNR